LARPVWVPDVSRDKGYLAAEKTTAAELAVPLFSPAGETNVPVGVINIELAAENSLDDQKIAWPCAFSAPLGQVVTNELQQKAPANSEPTSAAPVSSAYTEVHLFCATDRNQDSTKQIFGAQRASQLSYGDCRVTIPRSHQLGKVEPLGSQRKTWDHIGGVLEQPGGIVRTISNSPGLVGLLGLEPRTNGL
jgi:hypothetical protein